MSTPKLCVDFGPYGVAYHFPLRIDCGARLDLSRRAPPVLGWTPTATGMPALGVRPSVVWGAGMGPPPRMVSYHPLSWCPHPTPAPAVGAGGECWPLLQGTQGGRWPLRPTCSFASKRKVPPNGLKPIQGFSSVTSAPSLHGHCTAGSGLT